MEPGTSNAQNIIWLVSRHPGTVRWLKHQGIQIDRHVDHLDIDQVKPGDTVIGTLPVNLAAKVCAKPAQYCHLSLEVPAELRGKDLSENELDQLNASLENFHVELLRPLGNQGQSS